MRRILCMAVLAVGVLALGVRPSYGEASQKGCEHSGNQANGCTEGNNSPNAPVPEPGSLGLIAAGVAAIGAAGMILNRKRSLPQ